MNFAARDHFRGMRARLQAAIKRGRLAVIDVGTSKISCLILKLDQARFGGEAGGAPGGGALDGAVEVVGARTVQARGIRRGEIVDMEAAARAVRQALLAAEKMASPAVERVDHAVVAFSGGRPESFFTEGTAETETGQVTERDISNALAAAPEPPVGEGRQILHAQTVAMGLDHVTGITDPRGMTGRRLTVGLHVLAVDARPLANLMECVRQCDLDLAGVVSAPYAAGLAALVEDEQRLGAICIDMGGGGTSMSVFLRDHLICAEQIRIGGAQVTADIAAGLMVRQNVAERLKTLHGGAVATAADDREMLDAPRRGEEESPERRQVSRGALIGVIRPRVEEVFRHLRARMVALGLTEMPGSAIVLTGAACQMPGLDDVATRVLGRRPRIGRPLRIAGLPQALSGPESAAAVGLALYVMRPHDELWDFEPPRLLGARTWAAGFVGWLRESW